jgi:hypothetical protein
LVALPQRVRRVLVVLALELTAVLDCMAMRLWGLD